MVGVAYRGRIALEDIRVDFEVEPIELPTGIGFGVKELVTLKGQISGPDRIRLQRASQFCPVGQALTKGSIQFEDEVEWSSGDVAAASPIPESILPLAGDIAIVPTGSVHGRYLLNTKEYDEDGGMAHEGEVKVAVACENLTHSSRWTVLAGHSSDGWVPGPFPLSQAAWAASSAATLSQLLRQGGEEADSISVELAMAARGGRGQSQDDAAAGVVGHRSALRRVIVPGNPRTTPLEVVQAALQRDPITIAYRNGGVLLHDEVVVE